MTHNPRPTLPARRPTLHVRRERWQARQKGVVRERQDILDHVMDSIQVRVCVCVCVCVCVVCLCVLRVFVWVDWWVGGWSQCACAGICVFDGNLTWIQDTQIGNCTACISSSYERPPSFPPRPDCLA